MENKKAWKIVLNITLDVIVSLMLAISILYGYYRIVYTEAYVVGPSMYPTLNYYADDADIVAINTKASYSYGDIVTAKHGGKSIIKRVIALEGDYVDIVYNSEDELVIMLNGEVLTEDYIKLKAKRSQGPRVYSNWQEYIGTAGEKYVEGSGLLVGEDEVFLLGDNRSDSNDSSAYGPVPKSSIYGKVDFVYRKGESNIICFIKKMILKMS